VHLLVQEFSDHLLKLATQSGKGQIFINMASAFHQWVADPLFSAAEVVQDSADRMESVFRLLQHEQSLAQVDHPDPKLLASVEYHTRDLATSLETAKWQLEDFEREVNLSAMSDKSQTKQNVISRHKQFIRAIAAQIVHVEKTLHDTSAGEPARNAKWVNLNEQDRDGLAMFLSGVKPAEYQELEERNVLRRFLDPTASSSFNDEITELDTGKSVKLNMNGVAHSDHNSTDLKQMSSHEQNGSWDLEANESNNFFHKNKLRGLNSRMKVFRSLGNLMSAYRGINANRSFTKRWKDGEEQRHSSSYNDLDIASQNHFTRLRLGAGNNILGRFCNWIADIWPRYRRSTISIQLISLVLLVLILLGMLVARIA
jgi:hypothetical protein